MTLYAVLQERFPKEMAEYAAAPWDFRIFPPSMDDPAEIHVTLHIGKTKADKTIRLIVKL